MGHCGCRLLRGPAFCQPDQVPQTSPAARFHHHLLVQHPCIQWKYTPVSGKVLCVLWYLSSGAGHTGRTRMAEFWQLATPRMGRLCWRISACHDKGKLGSAVLWTTKKLSLFKHKVLLWSTQCIVILYYYYSIIHVWLSTF